MLSPEDKLARIGDMCRHPGAFHWTGRQMANAIRKVIDDELPICFELSELDHPIPYELVHDAVSEELEEQ